MENRNFHTALLGGFRKKDVVNFLAEDKRRHDEALQEMNTQVEEAVEQIKQLMEQRDHALEQVQELHAQQEAQQAALEAARQENVRNIIFRSSVNFCTVKHTFANILEFSVYLNRS